MQCLKPTHNRLLAVEGEMQDADTLCTLAGAEPAEFEVSLVQTGFPLAALVQAVQACLCMKEDGSSRKTR